MNPLYFIFIQLAVIIVMAFATSWQNRREQ